jgi:hypothetical protein
VKKLILGVLIVAISGYAFSDDLPGFLIEANGGYAVGINLNNAMQAETRSCFLYEKFGLAIEVGGLFSTNYSAFHLLVGPMFLAINNEKWRLPIIIGFDFMNGKTTSFGIGGIIALHYRFAKNFYAGINIGIVYVFDKFYEELTGYKTNKEIVNDGTGNAVFVENTVPIYENIHHYGNSFYFKPSLSIGLQF